MNQYQNVTIFNHPLIQHKVAILRDERTAMKRIQRVGRGDNNSYGL